MITHSIKFPSTLCHTWRYPLILGWMRWGPCTLRGILLLYMRGGLWRERSSVTYIEGCIAPFYDTNHLRATVVDLYCTEGETIKYSTINNWYVRDEECRHGIYNFIMKRGLCDGGKSRISCTWVEIGLTITWKYSSIILKGNDVIGEFYYVSLKNNYQ